MIERKRVLVTGNKGFIGKAMFDVLWRNEDYYVIGYDLREEDNFEPNIEYVRQIIESNNINIVMHFGAISSTTEKDLDKILTYNYDFTRDLIDICYEKDILLQFASSASVYGSWNYTFKETDKCNPESPYALSKYLCERYIEEMIMEEGAKIQAFRLFNVFSIEGKMEEHKGNQASPYYKFIKAVVNGERIKLFHGSEKFSRDFVSIWKVIGTMLAFIDVEEDGIWNLGTGEATSFYDVAHNVVSSLIFDDVDSKVEYIDIPEEIEKQYQTFTKANMTKLNETLKRHGKY